MENKKIIGEFRQANNVIVYYPSWGSCGVNIGNGEKIFNLKDLDKVEFEIKGGYAINVKFLEHKKVIETDYEKLLHIAEEMAKDLTEQSEFIDSSFESLAKYYNFKQNLKK